MGADRYLDLIGLEVLNGVSHSSIATEARYHELLQELVRHDLLRKRGITDPQDGRS